MKTRHVLEILGFEEDTSVISDRHPGYRYDFGNLQLQAAEVTNEYLRPVFYFFGVWHSSNALGEVSFDMPLEVESYEQGVAWIVEGVGSRFRPARPVPWIIEGREWRSQLPWVREMEAFRARPRCSVERDWFRVAAKKLRERAAAADSEELARISFDGTVLRIATSAETLAMPADGKAWQDVYAVKVRALDFLRKRLMRPVVSISIWKGHLTVNGRRFPLV